MKTQKYNKNGEKLYPISITKHQHDIDTACVKLRLRIIDAEKAGDHEAAKRLWDRFERAQEYFVMLSGSSGVGWFTGKQYEDCMKMINWVRECRMAACEAAGIPYVE